MKKIIVGICRFYIDGFRNMTIGRILWLIILIKLFVIFFVLKVFFFPDFLDRVATDSDKDDYVSEELIIRSQGDGQP